MRPVHSSFFIAALLAGLAALTDGAGAGEARVTGTATYLDRAMLPLGAVLEVVLEDVSRPDAPAEVIATDTRDALGAPPFAFSLAYDPADIDERHSYSVRQRPVAGGCGGSGCRVDEHLLEDRDGARGRGGRRQEPA